MKKILAIDQGEHLGGAEIFLSETLRALTAHYEVHLLTSGDEKYSSLYKDSKINIHHADLPRLSPFSPRALLRFRRAAAALGAQMAEIKPDLVISNTVRTHILSSSATVKAGIPLLWFAHDITFPKALLRRFVRFPKTIVCCSRFVRDYYEKAIPGKGRKPTFEVIYPFNISEEQVEKLARIAPDKLKTPPTPEKPRIVGMVGNFIPWKGQDLFIKASSSIAKTHPDVRFEIIGRTYEGNPSSEIYRERCEELAAPLIAAKVLEIRESVPSAIEEMAKWQILVHCSKEPEPLGRVILEGMAAGCVVIASNLGGPREIVSTPHDAQNGDSASIKGPDGILADPDVKSLTEAVSSLLNDPQKAQTLAKNARAKILRDYSQEKMHANLAEIIVKTF